MEWLVNCDIESDIAFLRRWLGGGINSKQPSRIPLIELKRLASAVQLPPWPLHFKAVNGIPSCPPPPLSVRYFQRDPVRFLATMKVKDLNSNLPLAQSAFSPLVADNRSQHCPCRSHAILAHTVGITLQGHPANLTSLVAKQSLYGFGSVMDRYFRSDI